MVCLVVGEVVGHGLGGGAVAEGGVQAASVVVDLDVLSDHGFGYGFGGQVRAVGQLVFQLREPGFGYSVVVAATGPPDRQTQVEAGRETGVLSGRILGPPIGTKPNSV